MSHQKSLVVNIGFTDSKTNVAYPAGMCVCLEQEFGSQTATAAKLQLGIKFYNSLADCNANKTNIPVPHITESGSVEIPFALNDAQYTGLINTMSVALKAYLEALPGIGVGNVIIV